MKTTLNQIRKHSPCTHGWTKLLKNLRKTKGDDEPLAITTILDNNGLDDAIWCLRAVDGHLREIRLFAVDCARSVQHLMTDARNITALDVAERHANGLATDQELATARNAAEATTEATAWSAAMATAHAAARETAWDAAHAAANNEANNGANWIATWSAEREVQADLLRIICAEIEQRDDEGCTCLPKPTTGLE